jgi:hypothetical protein
VFDWESCQPEAPVGWDAFHFSMQVASLHRTDWRTKFDLATARKVCIGFRPFVQRLAQTRQQI